MRLLAVTYGLPHPLTEGAKIRDYNLLRELARHSEVHLLCFSKDDPAGADPRPLEAFCASVEIYRVPNRLEWFAHLRSGRPLAVLPCSYAAFSDRIAELARQHQVDVVQIEHSFLAGYVTAVPEGPLRVLSLHNIGETQYASLALLPGAGVVDKLKAWAMRDWEATWAARFDHCIAVSEPDAAWLRARASSLNVTVIPNGVDCAGYQPLPENVASQTVLFVGTLGYPPNADAVTWFAGEILPRIRLRLPSAKLRVVGCHAPDSVRALAATGQLTLVSDAADLRPHYSEAALCVVPLRAGGGTRLKILEAMAFGRAVISSPIGCEGLATEFLAFAADAPAFAAACIDFLQSPERREALTQPARKHVERHHDWSHLAAQLAEVHRLGGGR